MPLRVSGTTTEPVFSDIDPNFTVSMTTGDLLLLKDDVAVKTSLRNLLATVMGERLFQPGIGSCLRPMLFEPIDSITTFEIRDRVQAAIVKHEPRIENFIVDVVALPDENEYRINVEYSIRGVAKQDKLSMVLERIR